MVLAMPNQSQSYAKPYAALAVLCTATFVASLDLFIVNVAFNAIGHDYRTASQSDLSWVLNGYAIVFAALLVPAGRLADRFGRRAAFLLGLGLFTAASAGGALLLAAAIGALALGLVKGPDWGWTAAPTLAAYLAAAAGVALVAYRSARHAVPVIEPALLRVRTFAWSNAAAIAFSASFAANMLLLVLWLQRVWHWSAIDTGLGVAPGPMMVPAFAVVAHRLQRRLGSGAVTAIGCLMFAASVVLMLTSLGLTPSYSSEVLPALILGGSGIGLALPEIMSASTSTLPPDRTSTGSAIVNMSRQIGSVLGISVMIAILGT